MRLGPGVVRELHWHKESEWGYVIEGTVRITIIDSDRVDQSADSTAIFRISPLKIRL